MANVAAALVHSRATSGLQASTTAASHSFDNEQPRFWELHVPPPPCRTSLQLAVSESKRKFKGRRGSVAGNRLLEATTSRMDRPRPLGSSPVAAVPTQAAEQRTAATSDSSGQAQLTWLENNGWIWELAGVRLLVDPWLEGNLDFDIPAFYSAKKKATAHMTVAGLPPLDALLITQSLDDHCHMKTLRVLAKARPNLPVLAPPSAQSKLEPLFQNLTLLKHGEVLPISGADGASVQVRAVEGDLVGPPWQPRENGYVLSTQEPAFSLYYEPHCKAENISEDEKVDCVITPTVSQKILGWPLVAGEEQAIDLARKLKAKYIVPMLNGDLEATGLLSLIVKTGSTAESFQKLASPEFVVLTPEPGQPLAVPPTT